MRVPFVPPIRYDSTSFANPVGFRRRASTPPFSHSLTESARSLVARIPDSRMISTTAEERRGPPREKESSMKSRILCLGLVAAVTQLFGSGCLCFHPVARWRANHPCGACGPCGACKAGYYYHPLLHPILTRRGFSPGVGPVATEPACHGCGMSGVPVSFSGSPGPLVPVTTSTPSIGYPMPLTPGPTVIPSSPLPSPMPVPNTGGK